MQQFFTKWESRRDPSLFIPVSYTHLDVYKRQNTGHEILQIQPREVASNGLEAGNETDTEVVTADTDGISSSPSGTSLNSKKRNVINSRFDIDFDRSRVGRKVATLDQ